jgi:hypothetical protein
VCVIQPDLVWSILNQSFAPIHPSLVWFKRKLDGTCPIMENFGNSEF